MKKVEIRKKKWNGEKSNEKKRRRGMDHKEETKWQKDANIDKCKIHENNTKELETGPKQ